MRPGSSPAAGAGEAVSLLAAGYRDAAADRSGAAAVRREGQDLVWVDGRLSRWLESRQMGGWQFQEAASAAGVGPNDTEAPGTDGSSLSVCP